jgi:SAM-dependent methyltransferase
MPPADAPPLARYTAAYYDRWYRHPRHRVRTPAEVGRLVALTVAAAEYVLERPVRTVLDVGAGEGHWRPHLRRLRPRVRYLGVEPSEYAVRRFGRARNLRRGTLGTLDVAALARFAPGGFDLVVACGVLNYVPEGELAAGLRTLHGLTRGAAFLELFAAGDDLTGDVPPDRRPAPWYRRLLRQAGFAPCGLHLYLPRPVADGCTALELPAGGAAPARRVSGRPA